MNVKTNNEECFMCVNKPLCKYPEQFENIKNDVNKQIEKYDESVIKVKMECRGFLKKPIPRERGFA